jgi:hypothetical protein
VKKFFEESYNYQPTRETHGIAVQTTPGKTIPFHWDQSVKANSIAAIAGFGNFFDSFHF